MRISSPFVNGLYGMSRIRVVLFLSGILFLGYVLYDDLVKLHLGPSAFGFRTRQYGR